MVGMLLEESVRGTFSTDGESSPGGRPVDFQQTIPRNLVHRAAVSEVFVTDLNIVGEGQFEVGAQWPRRHGFFGPRTAGSHDPMLYAETTRQASLLIAHRAYGVSLGNAFISDWKTSSIAPEGLVTEGRPIDVVLRASAHDPVFRGKNLIGMRTEFGCFRDDELVGTASETWRCVSPAVYRRLRGDHFAATPFQARALPTVAPALVGRDRGEDVLVAETAVPGTWSLQFDPDHPVLFDHSVDHVPGMVLIEGARQAALLTLGDPYALPLRSDFEFSAYVEFDSECLLVAEELEPDADGCRVVRVVLEQKGRAAATGILAMRRS
ncbi:ScbA/BarX family gamma-butyrolactone biosynthesis protein [Amycolatopsis nivea]|uniref:ScbA/BarX family gamma-butyrolactone biosynthesis protein n=1 Tax=Amycolatopsis nivea TaxID=1644109 RepID=UPI00107032AE|nr:ScbA/BarX family gamma-butyrolactone biosynthesis protein [Amycolatopsis nivea]